MHVFTLVHGDAAYDVQYVGHQDEGEEDCYSHAGLRVQWQELDGGENGDDGDYVDKALPGFGV